MRRGSGSPGWGTELGPTDEVKDQYDEQDDHENTDQAVARPSNREWHQFLLWMSAPQLVTRSALLNAEVAGEATADALVGCIYSISRGGRFVFVDESAEPIASSNGRGRELALRRGRPARVGRL
jgi:hypothetical protein